MPVRSASRLLQQPRWSTRRGRPVTVREARADGLVEKMTVAFEFQLDPMRASAGELTRQAAKD